MFQITISDFYIGQLIRILWFTHSSVGNFRDVSLPKDRVPMLKDEGLAMWFLICQVGEKSTITTSSFFKWKWTQVRLKRILSDLSRNLGSDMRAIQLQIFPMILTLLICGLKLLRMVKMGMKLYNALQYDNLPDNYSFSIHQRKNWNDLAISLFHYSHVDLFNFTWIFILEGLHIIFSISIPPLFFPPIFPSFNIPPIHCVLTPPLSFSFLSQPLTTSFPPPPPPPTIPPQVHYLILTQNKC